MRYLRIPFCIRLLCFDELNPLEIPAWNLTVLVVFFATRYVWYRIFTPYNTLIWAIESGKVSAVKAALERGADMNGLPDSQEDEGMTPLDVAAGEGKIEIVSLLLDRGADVNLRDCWETPLTSASEDNRIAVVELLIARGATVNDEDENGSSALYRAAVEGKVAAVRVLLAHGANPNTHFIDGPQNTVLQVIGEFHHPEVAKVLRQAGAK